MLASTFTASECHATPSAHTPIMEKNRRVAHRLALDLAWVCMRVDGPDFGDLTDIASIIDGYSVSTRSIREFCRVLMALGCTSAFVQLHGLCALDDALDIADALDHVSGSGDLEEA